LFSYGPDTLNCSSQTCWAGGEFYYNGPYQSLYGDVIFPYAPSSEPAKFAGWIGLTNCTWSSCPVSGSTYVLVQSGFDYGSLYNGTSPNMFVELYGNFNWNGVSCTTHFCGYQIKEAGDDYTYNAEFYNSNDWTAYAQDNSQPNTPYTLVTDNVGVTGSLPYVLSSMEASGASSNSYINTPVYFTTLDVYYPAGTQINIDSSHMYSYVGPTASSGVSVSYSASGTTTGSATVT
jgi:hypothetical protein